jgi:hypothetical protein
MPSPTTVSLQFNASLSPPLTAFLGNTMIRGVVSATMDITRGATNPQFTIYRKKPDGPGYTSIVHKTSPEIRRAIAEERTFEALSGTDFYEVDLPAQETGSMASSHGGDEVETLNANGPAPNGEDADVASVARAIASFLDTGDGDGRQSEGD